MQSIKSRRNTNAHSCKLHMLICVCVTLTECYDVYRIWSYTVHVHHRANNALFFSSVYLNCSAQKFD